MAEKTHGMSHTPIWECWYHMKQRCTAEYLKDYHRWGGRGISYDKRWDSFENFYTDMKDGYRKGLTLDRIDNNADYSRDNCRWADRTTQNRNRRDNRRFKYKGKNLLLSEWSEILNIKRSTLAQRIYSYKWAVSKALSTPLGKRGK